MISLTFVYAQTRPVDTLTRCVTSCAVTLVKLERQLKKTNKLFIHQEKGTVALIWRIRFTAMTLPADVSEDQTVVQSLTGDRSSFVQKPHLLFELGGEHRRRQTDGSSLCHQTEGQRLLTTSSDTCNASCVKSRCH